MNPIRTSLSRIRSFGVRVLLIALLLPGVTLLLVVDSWNDYQTLSSITSDAYDSALLEPAWVLESSVEFTADHRLRVTTPLYAQLMLESRAGMRKYYRIEEIDPPVPTGLHATSMEGTNLSGMPDLPRPPEGLQSNGEPVFFDSVYRGDPVRAVAILRNIYQRDQHSQILIIVAESISRRVGVESEARRQEILRDTRMLALVAILVWWGVAWALRPLDRLRSDIRSRPPDDLTPLDPYGVPREVVPLVDAVNYHIDRHRRLLEEQASFLADASHQLRTPLAILSTQAQYALRERDPARMREGLDGIVVQLARTRRLTEQLLSLAHASQNDGLPRDRLDLNEVARQAVLQHLPLAREKRQDLGWVPLSPAGREDEPIPLIAQGIEAELHEALSNLLHNAIHYAPVDARITVSVSCGPDRAEIAVCDNGPGLPERLRERAFARFARPRASVRQTRPSGSGLGLAIARAYARRNGGDIELRDGEPNAADGVGLCAILWLPLASDPFAPNHSA